MLSCVYLSIHFKHIKSNRKLPGDKRIKLYVKIITLNNHNENICAGQEGAADRRMKLLTEVQLFPAS